MLVREKVDERQFEWYRDNNEFYYITNMCKWTEYWKQYSVFYMLGKLIYKKKSTAY